MYLTVESPFDIAKRLHQFIEPPHEPVLTLRLELIDMVRLGQLQIEERAIFCDVSHTNKLLLHFLLSCLPLDAGDPIGCSFVGGYVLEERRDPLGLVDCLDLQWREDDVFVADGLAVDPGVAVVELEHVNASLGCHYAALELSRFLLTLDQQVFNGLLGIDLSEVVEPDSHVEGHNVDSEVKERVIFQYLEGSQCFLAAIDNKGVRDLQRIEGLHTVLLVTNQTLLVDLACDLPDPC